MGGGGGYDRDAYRPAPPVRRSSDFATSEETRAQSLANLAKRKAEAEAKMSRQEPHKDVLPKGRTLVCLAKRGVVFVIDGSATHEQDFRWFFEKIAGGWEYIRKLLAADFGYAAFGDATDGDKWPVQVTDFVSTGRESDVWLPKLCAEGKGGGGGRESAQLIAYEYAEHCEIPNADGKSYFVIVTDEGFYDTVSAAEVRTHIGDELAADIPAVEVFRKLQEKFHVFVIFQQKTAEEKRAGVDREIAARLKEAGGKDGEVRVSLIWHNKNDLDLHVFAPSGEKICFYHKNSRCGGELDVDRNVHGETTKPVENIVWARGSAPKGRYRVVVQNYAYHEAHRGVTEFQVEVKVGDKVTQYKDLKISGYGPSSNLAVCEFDWQGHDYSGYDDARNIEQWATVIPREHILVITESKAAMDTIIGAIALREGAMDLAGYADSLGEGDGKKRQTPKRIAVVSAALRLLDEKMKVQNVTTAGAMPKGMTPRLNRRGGVKRL